MVESVYTTEQIDAAVKILEAVTPEMLLDIFSIVRNFTPERLLKLIQEEKLREKKVSGQVLTLPTDKSGGFSVR